MLRFFFLGKQALLRPDEYTFFIDAKTKANSVTLL